MEAGRPAPVPSRRPPTRAMGTMALGSGLTEHGGPAPSFEGTRRAGEEFIIAFRVGDERLATVRVAPGRPPRVFFPHLLDEDGESLGAPALDAELCRRAEQLTMVWEGGREWALWRRGR